MSSGSKGDILIVDDKLENLRLLASLLQEQGYEVRAAINGSIALQAAKAAPPDLILLDINMPGMSGYEVCQELKATESTKQVPIIFISALSEVWDKVKALTIGGVDYITKPFQVIEVLARVENQLTIRRLQLQLEDQNAQLRAEVDERQRAQAALQAEQEKSEQLLLNILPKAVAAQLKQDPGIIAEHFSEATILFADLVQFTELASMIPPRDLVELLNHIFSQFDELTEQYGLEKVKTIGDAYMVVGGLPDQRAGHTEAMAVMALELHRAVATIREDKGHQLFLRVGIHCGPVVAGVIGTKKFSYDLWGDTVNIASRMESTGEAGRIQVTEEVYRELQSAFAFQERGMIPVKGKGQLRTYWLLDQR